MHSAWSESSGSAKEISVPVLFSNPKFRAEETPPFGLWYILIRIRSKALTTEVSTYLMMAVAKMFRLLYSAEPHNAASLFSIEPIRWRGCSDAVMRMSEANVEALLTGQDVNGGEGVKDPACLSMTTESLTREFPLYTPSLLNLVKTSETHVKGLSPEG